MKRIVMILTVLWAALATAASPALATDLCFQFGLSNVVAKGFIVPRKNTCKPLLGSLSLGGSGAIIAGAGCTSADGQLLRIHFTAHGADSNFFESAECDFRLPTFADGNCQVKILQTNDNLVSEADSATAARCTVNNP